MLGFSRSSRPFLSNTDKKLSSNDSFCLCLYLPILTFERQNKQALKTAMSLSNIDTWEEIFVTGPLRHLIDFYFQVRYLVKQTGKCTARCLSANRRRKVRTGRTDQVYAMALLAASEARHNCVSRRLEMGNFGCDCTPPFQKRCISKYIPDISHLLRGIYFQGFSMLLALNRDTCV